MFESAREKKPSIIFIDEITWVFSPLGKKEDESRQRSRNEFFMQMSGANDGVRFIAAASNPWEINAAIRRRFIFFSSNFH